MFVIVGSLVVVVSIVIGYTAHGGQLGVLWQWTEMVILIGVAVGTLLIANPLSIVKAVVAGVLGSLKGSHINKQAYMDLLKMLYELFQLAKKDGLLGLEPHIENPASSSIFSRYDSFSHNHHAVDFLCDTLKVVLNGGIPAYDLEDLMNMDIDTVHAEELKAPAALNTVSDAMPGIGIVAAVLGVVITMGKIDQPPAVIGHSVAAALVGTFLGILFCYGFLGPLAKNMEGAVNDHGQYIQAIKASVLAFVKGVPPIVAVEYARRSIPMEYRPSFKEAEEAVKQK